MKSLINALNYLQNNDKNGTLTIQDAKMECVQGNNFQIGNKFASLAMELQSSL